MLIAVLALSLLMQDPSEAAIDCAQAMTTLDMNACVDGEDLLPEPQPVAKQATGTAGD